MTREPPDVKVFWHRFADRIFMHDSLYPRLGMNGFRAILDIGARKYDEGNIDLFNTTLRPKYYQIEPYPARDATFRNDGTLTCTMQQAASRYPELCSFFDVVLDLGVLGVFEYPFTPDEITEYMESVRHLLEPGGLYVLKTDGPAALQRLQQVPAFVEHFRPEHALGYSQASVDVGHNPSWTFRFYTRADSLGCNSSGAGEG